MGWRARVTASTAPAGTATNPPPLHLRWPTGIPPWQQQELTSLSAAGDLGGVAPQIIAWLSKWESGFGVAGLAVNTTSYGGYFGLGTLTSGRGSLTSSQLTTASAQSYGTQAQLAAKSLAGYGHPLLNDLQEYVTGTPTNTSSAEPASIYKTSGASKTATLDVTFPLWLTGPGAVYGAITGKTPGHVNLPNPLTGLADIGKFFVVLGQNLRSGFGIGWGAVGSILLGITLIIVGLGFLGYDVIGNVAGKVAAVTAVA